MSRSQLLSALSNWLAFAATLAVAFVLTPFLIAHLGTGRYDVWCVAEAILAYFTLLDMGLAACLVRGVARHKATDDPTALNRMASTCLALFSGGGAIALIVGVPVMLAIAPRFGNSTDVLAFLLIMAANLAITLPLSVFPSVLDGLDRYAAKSIVRLIFLAIRTAAIIIILQHEAALLPLAMLFTILNVLEHATLAFLAFRFLPSLQFSRGLVNRQTFREIRGFSINAFLAMLAGRITVQTGTILVGLFLPLGAVTIFVTASRLIEYAKTLLRTITATLTPGVSAMEARGDWPGIRRLLLTATRLVLYLVLPIQLGLWFFGTPFLVRWVPQVGSDGTVPLMILSLTLTLSVAQSVASRMLYGLGILRRFARLALLEAALNLILLFSLIPSFELMGVAIAIAVPNIIFNVAVIIYTLRCVGISIVKYLKAWSKPLLMAGLPLIIWSLRGSVDATWPAIFTAIAMGLIPYGIAVAVMEWAAKAHPKLRVGLGRYRFGRRKSRS